MGQNNLDKYVKYYADQAGSGISVYKGSHYQKGHGIGSFLGGLFRAALPIFKSGARALGHQALTTGANFLGDIAQNKNVKESFKTRLGEAGDNLKRKATQKLDRMAGAGLKRKKPSRLSHSLAVARRKRTSKKKLATKPQAVQDIFS